MAEIYVKLANGTMQKVHLETDSAQVKGLNDAVKIIKVDNTVSADKLANAKEIKIQDADGNVSTAVNFDGSENVNLNLPDTIPNQKQLGYRQPSTAYTAGQIAYHASLPTGWYLECTTAGTTGSGDLTISSPTVGGTVTDGTVVWTVRNKSQIPLNYLGVVTGDYNNYTTPGVYKIDISVSGQIANGMTNDVNYGMLVVSATNRRVNQTVFETAGKNQIYTRPHWNEGGWGLWKEQDTIVAKSLGQNSYVKYTSGLIMQWGVLRADSGSMSPGDKRIDFPISFSQPPVPTVITTEKIPVAVGALTPSHFIVGWSTNEVSALFWFAIGY